MMALAVWWGSPYNHACPKQTGMASRRCDHVGIANKLTLLRVALSPVFVAFFVLGANGCGKGWFVLALVVAGLFELTDLLDGYFARARKDLTDFGKLADPMADSISRFSVFLCFLWGGYAHVWVVALVFYRDALVAYTRVAAARAGVVLSARLSGKLKAIAQGIVILAIMVLIVLTPLNDPLAVEATKAKANDLMLLVAVVTLWSGFDYLRSGLPLLRSLMKKR